ATDQAKLGASMNQIGGAADNLSARGLATASALSKVQDADMGAESTALAGAGIAEKAAIAMMLQANAQPDAVLRLLG
ncbi:MAG: flagellin, partial [Myxococcota bacterium]|nr:flagellin [Myxococcota bacterium]